jgi:Tol biopolymer transport system component
MRLDGGEAKRVTDAREGVSTYTFSKDGKSIVYSSGRSDNEQIYAIAVADLWATEMPKATQWTRHATGVNNWQFSPDGSRIYFIAPDSIDRDDRARLD